MSFPALALEEAAAVLVTQGVFLFTKRVQDRREGIEDARAAFEEAKSEGYALFAWAFICPPTKRQQSGRCRVGASSVCWQATFEVHGQGSGDEAAACRLLAEALTQAGLTAQWSGR